MYRFFLVVILIFSLCKKIENLKEEEIASFTSENNGLIIKKGKGKIPPTIVIEAVERKNLESTLSVPIRVGVSCIIENSNEISYQFENSEQSAIYSEFLKNKAALFGAKKSYARLKDLYEHQAVTGKEISDATVQLEQLTATVEENKYRLMLLGIQIEKLHELRPGWVFIIGDVPETRLSQVKLNSEAVMKFNSYPNDSIVGKINVISEIIDPITRTAKILIKLNNQDRKLKPGMFGTSRIELEKIEGIAIPNTAIIIMGDISYVFRNNSEDSFERIIIEPGIQSEEFTRVISGLSEGDKIVIQGANLFKGLSFGY